jgi:hypothetical protein
LDIFLSIKICFFVLYLLLSVGLFLVIVPKYDFSYVKSND